MTYSPQLITDSRPVTCSRCGSSAFLSRNASIVGADSEISVTQMHRVEVRYFISIRSFYRPTLRIENEDSAWFDPRFHVVLFDFKDQLGVGLPSQRVEEPMPALIVPPLFQHALEVGVHDENRR
jgi:hypothetical protein